MLREFFKTNLGICSYIVTLFLEMRKLGEKYQNKDMCSNYGLILLAEEAFDEWIKIRTYVLILALLFELRKPLKNGSK